MIKAIIDGSLKNRFMVLIALMLITVAGLWMYRHTPLDAIPDLSDVQVIVFTKFPGQAPQVVEDQVTYPLTTAMLAVPNAKVVRGYSFLDFRLCTLFSMMALICTGLVPRYWNI